MGRTSRIKFSGTDPDYDIAHFDDPRARAQARAEIEEKLRKPPPTPPKTPAPQQQEPTKVQKAPRAPKAESEAVESAPIKVSIVLKPPVSCQADLLALEEAGYEIDMILRAALRKIGTLQITERFTAHNADNDWADHRVQLTREVPRSTLEAIRADANDIGVLSNAALVRGQIQPRWEQTLETFISDLKKRL